MMLLISLLLEKEGNGPQPPICIVMYYFYCIIIMATMQVIYYRKYNWILDFLVSLVSFTWPIILLCRGEKASVLSDLIKRTNSTEMKWILMIILKGIRYGHVFCFQPSPRLVVLNFVPFYSFCRS